MSYRHVQPGPGPPARRQRRRRRARWRDDRGSATVEFLICAAAMVLLLMMVVQVGVWYHTSAVAQTAARLGLDHVRTFDGSTHEGIEVATEFIDQAGSGL